MSQYTAKEQRLRVLRVWAYKLYRIRNRLAESKSDFRAVFSVMSSIYSKKELSFGAHLTSAMQAYTRNYIPLREISLCHGSDYAHGRWPL
jgi:hypothetical protein